MKPFPCSRGLAGALAVVYFAAQCVLAQAPEANFWGARRRHAAPAKADHPPLRLGSLPTAAALPALPPVSSLDTSVLTPGVDRHLKERLTSLAAGPAARLLEALPASLGTVRDVRPSARGAAGKILLHIQDVHANAEAQRHIAAAVRALSAGGRVGLVALEGAFGALDFSGFQTFPQKRLVADVADSLLASDDIAGPVHAALTGAAAPFVGVDDPAHYDANVRAYRAADPLVNSRRAALTAVQSALEVEKARAFSPALLAFDRQAQAYAKGWLSLGDYARFLAGPLPAEAVPAPLKTFLKALDLEASLDFKQVEAERAQAVKRLAAALPPAAMDDFLRHGVAYRLGQLPHREFYRYLRGLCESHGVPLAGHPSLDAYIRYVFLTEDIDAGALLAAVMGLEKARAAALAATPRQRRLLARSKAAALTAKLLDFALTPGDWAEYEAAAPAERPSIGDVAAFENFYRAARARDAAMAENLVRAMEERKASAAVLVTGGFHGPGTGDALSRAGVTVVTFVPRLTRTDADGAAYLSVFSQEKTPLDKLFAGEKLFLSKPVWPAAVETQAAAGVVGAAVVAGETAPRLQALIPGLSAAWRLTASSVRRSAEAVQVHVRADGRRVGSFNVTRRDGVFAVALSPVGLAAGAGALTVLAGVEWAGLLPRFFSGASVVAAFGFLLPGGLLLLGVALWFNRHRLQAWARGLPRRLEWRAAEIPNLLAGPTLVPAEGPSGGLAANHGWRTVGQAHGLSFAAPEGTDAPGAIGRVLPRLGVHRGRGGNGFLRGELTLLGAEGRAAGVRVPVPNLRFARPSSAERALLRDHHQTLTWAIDDALAGDPPPFVRAALGDFRQFLLSAKLDNVRVIRGPPPQGADGKPLLLAYAASDGVFLHASLLETPAWLLHEWLEQWLGGFLRRPRSLPAAGGGLYRLRGARAADGRPVLRVTAPDGATGEISPHKLARGFGQRVRAGAAATAEDRALAALGDADGRGLQGWMPLRRFALAGTVFTLNEGFDVLTRGRLPDFLKTAGPGVVAIETHPDDIALSMGALARALLAPESGATFSYTDMVWDPEGVTDAFAFAFRHGRRPVDDEELAREKAAMGEASWRETKRWVRRAEAERAANLWGVPLPRFFAFGLDLALRPDEGVRRPDGGLLSYHSVFAAPSWLMARRVDIFVRERVREGARVFFLNSPFDRHQHHRQVSRLFLQAIARHAPDAQVFFLETLRGFDEVLLPPNAAYVFDDAAMAERNRLFAAAFPSQTDRHDYLELMTTAARRRGASLPAQAGEQTPPYAERFVAGRVRPATDFPGGGEWLDAAWYKPRAWVETVLSFAPFFTAVLGAGAGLWTLGGPALAAALFAAPVVFLTGHLFNRPAFRRLVVWELAGHKAAVALLGVLLFNQAMDPGWIGVILLAPVLAITWQHWIIQQRPVDVDTLYAQVLSLNREIAENGAAEFWPAESADRDEKIRRALADKRDGVPTPAFQMDFETDIFGRLTGYILYRVQPPAAGESGHVSVEVVAVHPRVRFQSAAPRLLRRVVLFAAAKAIRRVSILSDRQDEAGRAFYRSLGHRIHLWGLISSLRVGPASDQAMDQYLYTLPRARPTLQATCAYLWRGEQFHWPSTAEEDAMVRSLWELLARHAPTTHDFLRRNRVPIVVAEDYPSAHAVSGVFAIFGPYIFFNPTQAAEWEKHGADALPVITTSVLVHEAHHLRHFRYGRNFVSRAVLLFGGYAERYSTAFDRFAEEIGALDAHKAYLLGQGLEPAVVEELTAWTERRYQATERRRSTLASLLHANFWSLDGAIDMVFRIAFLPLAFGIALGRMVHRHGLAIFWLNLFDSSRYRPAGRHDTFSGSDPAEKGFPSFIDIWIFRLLAATAIVYFAFFRRSFEANVFDAVLLAPFLFIAARYWTARRSANADALYAQVLSLNREIAENGAAEFWPAESRDRDEKIRRALADKRDGIPTPAFQMDFETDIFGRLTGYILYRVQPPEAALYPGQVYVDLLAVRPSKGRRGAGTRLMRRAFGFALGRGIRHLFLQSDRRNPAAGDFYRTLPQRANEVLSAEVLPAPAWPHLEIHRYVLAAPDAGGRGVGGGRSRAVPDAQGPAGPEDRLALALSSLAHARARGLSDLADPHTAETVRDVLGADVFSYRIGATLTQPGAAPDFVPLDPVKLRAALAREMAAEKGMTSDGFRRLVTQLLLAAQPAQPVAAALGEAGFTDAGLLVQVLQPETSAADQARDFVAGNAGLLRPGLHWRIVGGASGDERARSALQSAARRALAEALGPEAAAGVRVSVVHGDIFRGQDGPSVDFRRLNALIAGWETEGLSFSSLGVLVPKALLGDLSTLKDLPADALLRRAVLLAVDDAWAAAPLLRLESLVPIADQIIATFA